MPASREPEPTRHSDALLLTVQDNTEVHRVVLPYRAWDMLQLAGREQAQVLLRQSVRYCVKAESYQHSPTWDRPRVVLPAMLEKYKLLEKPPGKKPLDDAAKLCCVLTFFVQLVLKCSATFRISRT